MKKILMPLLILTILIQLFVPSYIVFEKYDTLKNGREYKFEIELYDPYDAFRGRYVSLTVKRNSFAYNHEGIYGHIGLDNDGFAYIDSVSKTKPSSGDYVKSISSTHFRMPIDRYYTDEELAPEMESVLFGVNSNKLRPYVILRVKDGKAVIKGLYIDGIRIEDYMDKTS